MKKVFVIGKDFPYLKYFDKDWNFVSNPEDCDLLISYGGDGTLLETMHISNGKPILPLRNYAVCDKHNFTEMFDQISFALKEHRIKGYENCTKINNLKTFINGELAGNSFSEVCLRNINSRNAIRFDVYINQLKYVENIIGDGIILATSYGSTGYFRSITRTMFKHGVGLAFNNPTQPVTNIITDEISNFIIKIKRCDANIQLDNIVEKSFNIQENSTIEIKMSNDNVSNILHLGQFMCTSCREKRHSGIEHLYNFGDFLYKE